MFIRKREERRQGRCIFPGYKWCGPACSGPGAPVNDVDNCCRRHDLCLERGISPCKCDTEFLDCLRPKINRHTQKGKNAALMYRFMKMRKSHKCGQEQRRRKRI
ncbi:phospholipase [Bacillus sp. V59.32b]|uniref:phospholipase n=1 Tax=Bacillus sp. V59.32b TaxID=1758642 RepID=UPI000E3E18F6|nr:phospholipase [Bacillus sp. V59.32b]RFU63595.1 phospholipase [Bacillus sp. V59.32b]